MMTKKEKIISTSIVAVLSGGLVMVVIGTLYWNFDQGRRETPYSYENTKWVSEEPYFCIYVGEDTLEYKRNQDYYSNRAFYLETEVDGKTRKLSVDIMLGTIQLNGYSDEIVMYGSFWMSEEKAVIKLNPNSEYDVDELFDFEYRKIVLKKYEGIG